MSFEMHILCVLYLQGGPAPLGCYLFIYFVLKMSICVPQSNVFHWVGKESIKNPRRDYPRDRKISHTQKL